jgi:hypothetical protein
MANEPTDDVDQQLLKRLGRLESVAVHDAEFWKLLRELETRVGLIRGQSTDPTAYPGPASPLPLTGPGAPQVIDSPGHASEPTLAVQPQSRTLAELPLAGHAIGMLPYEYQHAVGEALTRIGASRRTLFLAALGAVGAGFYTGKLTIPEALKLQVCPPTQQPIEPLKVQQ